MPACMHGHQQQHSEQGLTGMVGMEIVMSMECRDKDEVYCTGMLQWLSKH